jgi:hypothetical protein
LQPVHEGHHDIRKKKMKGLSVSAGESESVARIYCAQDRVASHGQDINGQRQDLSIIVDHEDRMSWLG